MPVVKATAGWAFQHTAARRRLARAGRVPNAHLGVSTHSRPKAAGMNVATVQNIVSVSTHSRPKAAGWLLIPYPNRGPVSTHSRPKAAGEYKNHADHADGQFQHTAARRRLADFYRCRLQSRSFNTQPPEGGWRVGR